MNVLEVVRGELLRHARPALTDEQVFTVADAINSALRAAGMSMPSDPQRVELATLYGYEAGEREAHAEYEQIGCITEYLDGPNIHCHYDQFTDGRSECRDTHHRIDAIPVYRKKGTP